ncbi:23S rRNA (adenine-N6)-dimethyltransferase [Nocardia tenerifensis]|uniref:23S rRNA (Adenine-N6)-dimethyltransferase n=1 Tax=Nocardia tenerifensis TaxID=228006 RepID=A0A318JRD6_9NOCA|nr:23S ribosomal RNA methyltransferase Erm [Nocardia tenerifensis]PXX57445.1 23S rRNA (adenine-N6)-dimethyltransferase [Nocardia tenerifensis]
MSRNRSLPRARASTRKRLSQNFLADVAAARLIVRSSGVTPADLVLEIGPGDGMLTRQLLNSAGRVSAYEKDARYAELLRRRYAGHDRITLYHRDFREVREPDEPFAVVANVPFAITTDVVRWCLNARRLTSATLLTQREFARKHSGDYGRWTKLTVTHWPTVAMELGAHIGRESFRPVPRVDTAILHLRRRPRPLLPNEAIPGYRRVVELGFTGLGGSLANSLRTRFPTRPVRAACAAAGIAPDEPVGLIDPHRWLTLYDALRTNSHRYTNVSDTFTYQTRKGAP